MLVFVCATARAQDDDAIARARELGEEGAHAYELGDWEVARSLFHRARDLYPAPTLGVREARALVKLGRLVEAARVYDRVSTAPLDASDANADLATFQKAQASARSELSELRARIPHLAVRVDGRFDRVALAIDGASVPPTWIGVEHEIDPGLHTILASFDGRPATSTTLTLSEGEHRSFELRAPPTAVEIVKTPIAPQARARGRGQIVAGFVTLGASVVSVGFGVGFGVVATEKHAALDAVCNGNVCPPSEAGTLDDFHTLRAASTIAYVAGGVLAVAGFLVVLLAPSSRTARGAHIGPFGLSGVF